MAIGAGTNVGAYQILAKIGAGGMGEVYSARDTRLNRLVAIKILPAAFADDADRLRRFEQEAQAAGSLNHPNIVAVYELGRQEGAPYVVTELLDGETLRARLSGGPLVSRKGADYAMQTARGLAAAHAKGITHRDIKPENLFVTKDGFVKILDFGLAKVAAPKSAGGTSAPTVPMGTDPGVVMGTAGYMSPEQVRGLAIDHRSDIFSLGVVLYEMLAGKRAFARDSSIETMNAILKEEPPELPQTASPALARIMQRCIEKKPEERFQSARDLAFALEAPPSSGPHAAPVLPSRRRSLGLIIAAAVLVTAAFSIGASRLLWRTPEPPSWTGTILGGPEMALNPRPSPGGHLLAFQAMVDGLTQVAIMKPESGNWSILTRDRGHGAVVNISWSPDGTLIYYDRWTDVQQGIFSVPVLGGEERLVVENAAVPEALPDGTLLIVKLNAQRQPQLYRFWPGTGRLQDLPVRMPTSPFTNTPARAYPDGKTAVVFGEPTGKATSAQAWYTIDLSSGSMKRSIPQGLDIGDVSAFPVEPDGQSIVAAVVSGALTRITSFSTSGAATERTLFTVTSSVWSLDADPEGSLYASVVDRPVDVVRFSPDGTRFERLASFPQVPNVAGIMTVLPDGRAVLPDRASGKVRLMAVQEGKDPAPLVNTTEETAAPLATCGPREMAFMIGPDPHETIAFAEPATGRVVRRIAPGKGPVDSLACSPGGKTLYFAAQGMIWAISSAGGEAHKIRAGDSVVADPSGRRLIVQAVESSKLRQFSVPLDGSPEREIPLDSALPLGTFPLSPSALNADGRLLAPLNPRDSWFNHPAVIDTATGRVTRIPSDNQSDYQSLGWTADGQVIAIKTGLRATLWKFQPVAR